MDSRGLRRVAVGAVLVLSAALLSVQWSGHVDDGDSNLYRVVARNMAERGGWLTPSYLPRVYSDFREHLPFGLWPHAAVIRWVGEGALGLLDALWSLATVGLVGWLGTRLLGLRTGVLAMLVLATTETFFMYGARSRLDPLLVLLSLAAAAPLLLGGTGFRTLLLAAGLGGAAALIKGPFGLLPLVAAGVARGLATRSLRPMVVAGVAAVLGALPVTGFLLWDHFAGPDQWWAGYVQRQVLASATGARTDGKMFFWFPFYTVSRRFWPGFPLVLLGAWVVLRRLRAGRREPGSPPSAEDVGLRTVGLFCLLVLLGLCLPSRKLWNHALVAYPALALVAGAGVAPWVGRLLQAERRRRAAVGGLAALALIALVASAAGVGRLLFRPCVAPVAFWPTLDRLAPGSPIAVVAPQPAWILIAALAAERRLQPAPVDQLSALEGEASRVAFVQSAMFQAAPTGWREVGRAREWVLLVRDG
jgi:4-amino-4-deoxy-L-arabinose transferase-like glycosyltransferase